MAWTTELTRTPSQQRTRGKLPAGDLFLDQTVAARAPWSRVVARGELLSIVDLGGNQAVDCLLYNAHDTAERYSAPDTIAAQRSIFLTTGSVLRSCEGRALMTVVADQCGRHDTIGGACSKESNTLRYGHHTAHQHACVENFLLEGAKWGLISPHRIEGAIPASRNAVVGRG